MTEQRHEGKSIHIWRYRMKTRARLNAKSSRREVEGALVRIGGGFACLQPWVELGDPTLDKCLVDLAGARRWPMVRRLFRCAEYDEVARENGESLFEEMEVPSSHATVPVRDEEWIKDAVERGFSIVKLKCGSDREAERMFVAEMSSAYPALRWRLDFNETASAEEVLAFVEALPVEVKRRIDFIEDPCPFSEVTWAELRHKTRLRLAVDRESGPHRVTAQVMVIKPAVDEPLLLGEAASSRGQRLVVTSYMDHPLGQCFAAWEAARLALTLPGCVDVCGLQTHHLFEEYLFSEQLGEWSPTFRVPEGTGLGFDDLLEVLPWKRIS